MRHTPVLTREEVLAHGLPQGFIEHQRRQAHLERTRALGALFGGLWQLAWPFQPVNLGKGRSASIHLMPGFLRQR